MIANARRAATALLAALTTVVGSSGAQDWTRPLARLSELGVSGSLRAGYWSSTRDLDTVDPQFNAVAWGKATRELVPHLSYFIEGWAALRGPADATHNAADLREAYAEVRFGSLDARIGRQIVAWGRADGINPTDNVTPRDYTILVPDDADRRIGATGLRASWYAGSHGITALWLPEFRPNRVALPAPPPGVAFAERYDRWPGETWAVRAERTGGAVDWSLSFMRGRDIQPDLSVANDVSQTVVSLDHHRVWVAGADAAMNAGRFGLRAEAAYIGTQDESGDDPFTKNHSVFVVAGADRSFSERLNINLQYLVRYVRDFTAPAPPMTFESGVANQGAILNAQMKRVQHGATSRVRYSWLHETLEAEVASVAYFGPRGVAVLPKASYAIADHIKVVAGGEIYRGDRRSLFGLLRPNSVGYAELRLSF